MKSFADWTQEIAENNRKLTPAPARTWRELELLGEVAWSPIIEGYTAVCKGCGDWTPVDYDIEEFDANYHYCGRNSYCCP